jgi:branched-chain amino acid transport system permease protein
VFGVIDVVWICYAELVMVGMYTIWWLFVHYGVPLPIAIAAAIALVSLCGVALHQLVIRPVLGTPPINQLLVTGGVLFFMQAAATLAFGVEFRNLGLRMPIVEVSDMFFSFARILAFGTALVGVLVLWLFLTRTYLGTAIRAISQDREIMPLMGVDPRKIYLTTSAIGGGMAGVAASLLALQYDVHPAIGLSFGPITFMICVLGGLGNMAGGFIAAFVFAQFISVGGFYFQIEWGYVLAFAFFIVMMFVKPQGLFSR